MPVLGIFLFLGCFLKFLLKEYICTLFSCKLNAKELVPPERIEYMCLGL